MRLPTGSLAGLVPGNTAVAIATAVALLAVLALTAVAAWRAARRALRDHKATDLLTFIAAAVATGMTMNGMWRVAGNALHFAGVERAALFAFLELAMVTEAARARVHVRESAERARQATAAGEAAGRVTAGVHGAAVWLFASASGVVSSLDAVGAPAKLVRLAAPLIAAWLWEGGLSAHRRDSGAEGYWQAIRERVLARLGIAAPSRHSLSEATARWRVVRLGVAAVRAANAGPLTRWYRRRRVRSLIVTANTHADLAANPERRKLLEDTIAILRGADALIDLHPPAPWGVTGDGHSSGQTGGRWDGQSDSQTGGQGQSQTDGQSHGQSDSHRDGHRDGPDDGPDDGQSGPPNDRHQGRPRGRQTARPNGRHERLRKAARARNLLTANPDMPTADVMARAGVSESTVTRIKRSLRDKPAQLHAIAGGEER